MPSALVTVTKKHKFSMGSPDAGGNKRICVMGQITMSTFTQTTTTDGMELDLSADIPNLEGVFIQGDAGYVCQYAYSTTRKVECYNTAFDSTSDAGLTATTSDDLLNGKVFYFQAWGY